MKLSSISISNHSRIQDFTVEARRHVVIVGANNAGKTSVLRLLNLVLGASTAGLYQALSAEDLRDKGQPLIVELVLTDFADAELPFFHQEITVGTDGVTESLTIQLVCEPDPSDDDAVLIRRWFPESGHDRTPTREQIAAFGWRYMRSNRAGSTAMLDGSDSAVRTLLDATDLGKSRETLVKLLKDFNEQLGGAEPVEDLLTRVATHLSRSMPKELSADDLMVQSTADPDEDVLGNVTMFLKRGEKPASLTEQSDGFRQLIAMTLFDLAQGQANMVAIDEPELHLHPASQRTIAELLSGEGNQKIIVTHSPYIVQKFEPSEVVALDHAGRAHQIPTAAYSAVEKQRVSWWSPSLLEALTARYVIAVEGIADRIIVQGAARAKGIDLDRIGAVVLELGGAENFPHVHKLLGRNGFGSTLFGLVDNKESPRWIGAIGGRQKNVIDHVVFISDEDLEAEYCRGLSVAVVARALDAGGVSKIKSMVDSAGVDTIDQVTPEALAKYCRDRKVEAAVAVAAALTAETAGSISSISKLLDCLVATDLIG